MKKVLFPAGLQLGSTRTLFQEMFDNYQTRYGKNILDYFKITPTACLSNSRGLGPYQQNILEHTAAKLPNISTRG